MDANQLVDFCQAELVGSYCRDSAMGIYGGTISVALLCVGFILGGIFGLKYGREQGYREGRTDGFGSAAKVLHENPDWPFAAD
jgi:hypothetical protein